MSTIQKNGSTNWLLKNHLVEGLIILAAFLSAFFILARNAGGPVNSDNLFYMDAGLNGSKSIHTLFYYFHIYLQRIFMDIAPTPLGGARLFWAFLISSSGVLIYLSVRNFPFRNSRLNAILAVLLFLSSSFIAAYSGRTENDLTAMFMVSAILFFYLLSAGDGFRNPFLIGVIGFLIFLASRSKETAFMIAYIILGFGFLEGDDFHFRDLAKRLPALFIGFACGMLFFILLNSLIVHDPLWGFRPSDINQYFTAVENHARWGDVSNNYFNNVIFISLLFPFFLYLITGVQSLEKSVSIKFRLPWFYPLILIVFFTVLMIFSSGYKIQVIDRLFFPAIPVICIFGSQVLDFRILVSRKDWIWMVVAILLAGMVFGFLITIFKISQSITNYSLEVLIPNILLPILISIFLICFLWKNPDRIARLVLPVICVTVFILSSFYQNFQSFFIQQPVKQRMEQIFYPFSVFANRIHYDPGMKFFVSSTINKEQQMLLRRNDEVRSIFNVYFHQNASLDNFITQIGYSPAKQILQYEDPIPEVEKMDYDYALITSSDWERIQKIHGLSDQLLVKYNLHFDDQKSIALLVNKLRDDLP